MRGFVTSGPEDHQHPLGIICNITLSKETLSPSKLSTGFKKISVFEERGYFENFVSQKIYQQRNL